VAARYRAQSARKPEEEYTIVLGIPPVISPETAVKAAIVAEVKKAHKNKQKKSQ
jgi:hypothetical protein